MTDPQPEYVRVNVTSATCPPVYNLYGEKKAEVDLTLPSNIVTGADRVGKANMAISKLFLPMACVPQNFVPLLPIDEVPDLSFEVPSQLEVGLVSGIYIEQSGEFMMLPHPKYFLDPEGWEMTRVFFPVKHARETGEAQQWARFELNNGEHEVGSISELITCINRGLQENAANMRRTSSMISPEIYFAVESDNTISLNIISRSSPGFLLASNPNLILPPSEAPYIFKDATPATENNFDYTWVAFNEEAMRMFPSLPWIKTKIVVDDPFHPDPANAKIVYILDTKQAKTVITRNYCRVNANVEGGGEPVSEENCDLVSYHFIGSDVTTLTNIASYVITMGGGTFNQQVYPVNFKASTASAAQTTNVPIVEVYYPNITSPSQFTTDLIVIKDDFTNAAPIKISPFLLKERVLKLKVWVILKDGRMKEVVIPANSILQLQVTFELFPKT